MKTLLDNHLRLAGFDTHNFTMDSGNYRLIMVEQDHTGRTRPFLNKEGLLEMFLTCVDDGTFSIQGINTIKYTISQKTLCRDLTTALNNLLVNEGFREGIIYLNVKEVEVDFISVLRDFIIEKDLRIYILSRKIMTSKHTLLSDIYCHYDNCSNLVITKNRL